MNDNPNRGRPPKDAPKFTPEARARILQAVRLGLPFEHAAPLGGITPRTLEKWRKKGRESEEGDELADFEDEVLKAKAEGALTHLARLDHASRGVRRNPETGEIEEFKGESRVSQWWMEWNFGRPETRGKLDVTSDGKALPAATVYHVGIEVVDRITTTASAEPDEPEDEGDDG